MLMGLNVAFSLYTCRTMRFGEIKAGYRSYLWGRVSYRAYDSTDVDIFVIIDSV